MSIRSWLERMGFIESRNTEVFSVWTEWIGPYGEQRHGYALAWCMCNGKKYGAVHEYLAPFVSSYTLKEIRAARAEVRAALLRRLHREGITCQR